MGVRDFDGMVRSVVDAYELCKNNRVQTLRETCLGIIIFTPNPDGKVRITTKSITGVSRPEDKDTVSLITGTVEKFIAKEIPEIITNGKMIGYPDSKISELIFNRELEIIEAVEGAMRTAIIENGGTV